MMFASDLDGTLVYSHRRLAEETLNVSIRNVEVFNGREISFMTEKAIALLRDLSNEMMFVPVTTRTVEQYNRISLFREEIRPTYVITSNGGVVHKNGKVDMHWQDYIRTKINRSVASVKDVKRRIEEIAGASQLESIRVVDEFFVYLIIKPPLSPERFKDYTRLAAEIGWVFSVQGRKVYFIPSFINKWDAVDYVSKKEGKKTVYTAGDSNLDVCLIQQAEFGLIPRHGEAAVNFGHLGLTQKTGILASEEIIETILSKRLQLIPGIR
ncbi:haloacid dehalogenase [Sporosarcina sp. ANT_H38]|uniref:HAD family hydrolase n=1 Tax=Sporosarcina sp. ANT_H38 TaxID=2597358 RepID=UPI0011F1C72D|nr:HAD family hydrolase [Sporosarcina sp. ANT_H38]KAA0948521.1 haloacid dehalogenase [Sporosarcina sp. ANT_H38]